MIKITQQPRNNTPKVKEAFRAGKAGMVAQKIFRIIGRRLGTDITMSPVADTYSNTEGKFSGYLGGFGNGEMLRVNFYLGKSDMIISVDYWDKPALTPKWNIDMNGFNVIQVLDTVTDVVTGVYFEDMDLINEVSNYRRENRLYEQAPFTRLMKMQPKTNKEMMAYWLTWSENEEWYDSLQEHGKTDFNELYEKYSREAVKHNIKPPKSVSSLRVLVSNALKWIKEDEAAEKVPVADVKKGVPEDYIETTPEQAKEHEELMNNAHIKKFEFLRFICQRIKLHDPKYMGTYVYGTGGVGKSHHAKDILLSLPETFYMTGTISGYTGLLQLLFDHKDGEIIILDDVINKSDMTNPTMVDILKAALDSDPPRRIQAGKKRKKGEELPDDAPSEETMEDFHFNSHLLFITNYEDVPQPLKDRCWTLKMIFSNQQIAEIIESALEKVMPEAPMEDKKFILEFLKKNIYGKTLSFRLFKRCVELYLTQKNNGQVWEDFIKLQINE